MSSIFVSHITGSGFRLLLLAVCGSTLIGSCLVPVHVLAQQEKGAGVVLSGEASAKDVGLPIYPGSRRHKDKGEDSAGANFALWGAARAPSWWS